MSQNPVPAQDVMRFDFVRRLMTEQFQETYLILSALTITIDSAKTSFLMFWRVGISRTRVKYQTAGSQEDILPVSGLRI